MWQRLSTYRLCCVQLSRMLQRASNIYTCAPPENLFAPHHVIHTFTYVCVSTCMGPCQTTTAAAAASPSAATAATGVVETGMAHSFLCVSRQSLPHSVRRRSIPRQRTREYHPAALLRTISVSERELLYRRD